VCSVDFKGFQQVKQTKSIQCISFGEFTQNFSGAETMALVFCLRAG
jgi:hypothetical protein